MRKLLLGVAMLLFAQMGFGQAVSDNAVIPVSVTLNSILRLTVTSGGNINFVFNTIEQYVGGLGPGSQYNTVFNVSSSRDFQVFLGAEDADFIGFDTGNTIPLDYLAFNITGGTGADTNTRVLEALADDPDAIVPTGLAGKSTVNEYTIAWEFGTADALAAGTQTTTLLEESFNADIYMTNVFLSVQPN